ncbi:MAG TPA: hypothetical protein VJ773_10505 [Gemmatimonadales bacterium]|nr:hypothetical protein [Gemmatimonadales bacterium]
MVHETTTSLPGAEVLARAKRFFAERVPHSAAFPEVEGPAHLVLRGQGGEELTLAILPGEGATRVRGSSPMFDQAIGRFFSTLPPAGEPA